MYKKLSDRDKLRLALASVRGEEVDMSSLYKPVVYTRLEITRARSVLDRILKEAPRETSYIKVERKVINE